LALPGQVDELLLAPEEIFLVLVLRVTCLDKQVCENGLCVAECGCRACGAGKACGDSGKCVDAGCEKVTCEAGQVCVQGACKEGCDGAVCPGKAACVDGQCQAPAADVNPTGSAGSDAGGGISVDLGGSLDVSGRGGGNSGGGTVVPSGGATVVPSNGGTEDNSAHPIAKSAETATGCSCRVGPVPRAPGAWLMAGLALVALAGRRRSREG
jgi:MYXO-CTERM domain-containing protein